MKKTCILYGSSTGNAETIAKTIGEKLESETFDVAKTSIESIAEYDNLILGTSTWGEGDVQDDWEDFLPQLEKANLNNKTIAIYGVGDGYSHPDTFVNSIRAIYDKINDKGCTIVGAVSTDNYVYDDSTAVFDDKFIGLPLDEDNESEKTEERLENWLNNIKEIL